MASVGQFAQYLLRQDPQRDPARATLHNFVRHVLDQELAFSPAVIATFYARALQFDHWQSESRRLAEVVRTDVAAFLAHVGEDVEPWIDLRHSDTLQVVRLRVTEDLAELIRLEHEPRLKSGSRLKTVANSDKEMTALLLEPTGSLEVKVYPNLALVWGPRLRLCAPVSQLFYGPDLELTPDVRQMVEGSLLTTHNFHVDEDGAHGLIVRGHTFQKFETYVRAHLPDTQDLFTSLKKIERHFVEPQSDPYYQDLVTRLERANQVLANATPQGLAQAERVLNKGRASLKTIFPKDRLLSLLISHLEYGLAQKREPSGPRHA